MSAWQDPEVSRKFLDERRGAIPYGPDQLRMMVELVRHFHPGPRHLVDVGCGDGLLARTLMEVYPEATATLLDHSEPMLARARQAMADFQGRCEFRLADLAEPLAPYARGEAPDLVVSGFAIH